MLPTMRYPSHPPSNVVAPRNWHYQVLAEQMRPDEIEHWLAISGAPRYDPDVAARGFMSTPGLAFTVMDRERLPAAAGGFQEIHPGVWQAWMACSVAGWTEQWRAITKATRWLMGQLFQMGARRLFVDTIASREEACAWYRNALGMQFEGCLRRAGAGGEDIVFYARIAEDQS